MHKDESSQLNGKAFGKRGLPVTLNTAILKTDVRQSPPVITKKKKKGK